MNVTFFLTYSTILAAVYGMRPDFRHRIETFYKGDFRKVMAVYKKYTENNDTELVNPCERYSEMKVSLNPQEFTSIESHVITSLNQNMILTLDGRSNFSIDAVMECEVKKDNEKVFEFYVLLLGEWIKSFTGKKVDFIPVYKFEPGHHGNWICFATIDVYFFHVLRSTFTRNAEDQLRIRQSLQGPEFISTVENTLKKVAAGVETLNWTLHFDNFVLYLDENSEVQIPAITIFKNRIRKKFIKYNYMIIFSKNSGVNYPTYPFCYPTDSKEYAVFRFLIYNTGIILNGMWAFALDKNLVKPKSNINLIPSFINDIGL